ncbi:MAG TPA: alpha/beta fold hydrolase [Tepidisphaeraceae bacterium]|nr:alpha/beta fold hydrolase [Tepidisphaeraceae bacterium]
MPSASVMVPWLYLCVPLIAAGAAAVRARRGRTLAPLRELLVCCIGGVICGLMLISLYVYGLRGRVPPSQVAITCYWAIAVIYVLRGLNWVLTWGLARAVRSDAEGRACCPAAEVAGLIFRAVVLLLVGIPYVLAMVMIYRPHVIHPGTPISLLGAPYQDVAFTSTDGVPLRGWWIPAVRTARTDDVHPAVAWGQRTVIFCHGFGADKASQLRMVRDLVPNGYNVLAIDLRAHGQSGGQLTTFGDLERRDVLGAVAWVRRNHRQECKKLFGLGESLGAAALISAAADPSPEGQAIDALAVFAPYDSLSSLVQGLADDRFATAAGWTVRNLALPLAGGQLGTRVARYDPSRDVQLLWPRPILVIASEQDRSMDISRSRALFDAALQPRYGYWLMKGGRSHMLFADDKASLAVRVFFEAERSIL